MEFLSQDGVNTVPEFSQKFSKKEDILHLLDKKFIANDSAFYQERLGFYNKLCAKLSLLLIENMRECAYFPPENKEKTAQLSLHKEGSDITLSSSNLFKKKEVPESNLPYFLKTINTLPLEDLHDLKKTMLAENVLGLTYLTMLIEIRTFLPHITINQPEITTTDDPHINRFTQTLHIPYISQKFKQHITDILRENIPTQKYDTLIEETAPMKLEPELV